MSLRLTKENECWRRNLPSSNYRCGFEWRWRWMAGKWDRSGVLCWCFEFGVRQLLRTRHLPPLLHEVFQSSHVHLTRCLVMCQVLSAELASGKIWAQIALLFVQTGRNDSLALWEQYCLNISINTLHIWVWSSCLYEPFNLLAPEFYI